MLNFWTFWNFPKFGDAPPLGGRERFQISDILDTIHVRGDADKKRLGTPWVGDMHMALKNKIVNQTIPNP